MVFTDTLRNLIADGGDMQQIRQQAAREGLRSLRLAGAEKIAHGLTTIDEVLRAAPPFSD